MHASSSAPGVSRPTPFPGIALPSREAALPRLPLPELVGRDDDLGNLVAAITGRSAPVLTLLGPGGVGKTRLALTAAWQVVDTFRDGVAFVPLSTSTPCQVWETIARALGITQAVAGSWVEAIGQALSTRNMLLVLDECDHVGEAFRHLPAILAQCPDLVVLATSQSPLQLEVEQEFWVRPLELPAPSADPREIEAASAVQLFALRSRRRNPAFEIDQANAGDIAAIVRLLDGLPLAIELAAGQTRHFSPAELRRQLERSLPSLASAARDLPERHRSLLNMAIWSLDLLPPADRRRFLRLSVLEHDFTPEIAFRVMGIPDIDGWELLTSFADKSLITRAATDTRQATGVPGFSILHTLRAGARHLLQQDPDEYEQALRNHAAVYLAVARDAAREWHGLGYLDAFRTIDLAYASYAAIIEGARTTPALVEPAIELAGPLFWYWMARNHESRILPRLEAILSDAPETIPAHSLGVAHVTAGWLAIRQNQHHRAAWHFQESSRHIADPADPAAVRAATGEAYLLRNLENDPDAAISLLRRAVDLAKTRPDAHFELFAACFTLGLYQYLDGDIEEAHEHLSESLEIARAHGDSQSVAMSLIHLAQTDRAANRDTDALQKIREALPILEVGGDTSHILLGIDLAAVTIGELGDGVFARTLAAASQHIRQVRNIQRHPAAQQILDSSMHAFANSTVPLDAPPSGDMPSLSSLVSQIIEWRPAASPVPTSPLTGVLSGRELEILYMVADGKTSPQIAAELFVSPHTVKRHMANIRTKLGVRSQAAAVAMLQRDR